MSISATIHQQDMDSVVIKYASWNIITDIGIDCTNFESSLNFQIVTKTDANIIFQLLGELNKLKISQKGGEDIRCKLEFYRSGNIVQSYCIGSIIAKIGSNYYYTTPTLKAVIDNIVETSPTRYKEELDSLNIIPCIQKVSEYIERQSERIYKDITLYEDLSFTVFCNVGVGGKSLSTRFTNNQNGKDKDIPSHIVTVIQDILANEVIWDIPHKYLPQWIPINVSIKSNAQPRANHGIGF